MPTKVDATAGPCCNEWVGLKLDEDERGGGGLQLNLL